MNCWSNNAGNINKRFVFIIAIASVVYIITAINSSGYHHPDEHYQIVEFAGLKAGCNTGNDLTWEYDAGIRPALQPMMAFMTIKAACIFGVTDPFMLSAILRIVTALLALSAISIFIWALLPTIKPENRTIFMIIPFFLWFLPAINVRFSSETFSGLTLLLVIAILQSPNKRDIAYFWGGITMGISFEFRYQMGLCFLGIFLWLLLVKKSTAKQIWLLVSGSLLVLVVCTLIDSWFYGRFVVAPVNYLRSNLIDDMASLYGISPWHYYLVSIITRPTLLIGISIIASLLALCIFDRKNILVWCIIPYVVIHSCIPHKELRFLFPLANLTPLMVVYAWQYLQSKLTMQAVKYIVSPVLVVMILINTGGLVMLAGKPAGNGAVNMIRFIQHQYPCRKQVYCDIRYGPYTVGAAKGLLAKFYCDSSLTVKDIKEPTAHFFSKDALSLFVLPKGDKSRITMLESLGFTAQKESIPAWIEKMNRFYKVYPSSMSLVLYSKQSNCKFR